MIKNHVVPASGAVSGFQIDQSLRFNDDDNTYLSWTPSVAGNRKTWTFSCWVKRGNLGGDYPNIFSAGNGNSLQFNSTNEKLGLNLDGAVSGWFTTDRVFRDTSSWYHIVVAFDTTQATASDRIKVYVNGELQTLSASYPSQNYDSNFSNSIQHSIGQENSNRYFDGYLTETHFIDGQALTPDNFGELGTYGEWRPIEYKKIGEFEQVQNYDITDPLGDSSLLAGYEFNDNANDTTGNYNLVNGGLNGYTTSSYGSRAVNINGAPRADITIGTGTAFSISLWASVSNTTNPIFIGTGYGSADGLRLAGSSGDMYALIYAGGTAVASVMYPSSNYDLTKLNHFVISYDGGTTTDGFKLYVNGVLAGSDTPSAGMASFSSLYLGTDNGANNTGSGVYDSIYVFNRGVTQEEVTTLYGTYKLSNPYGTNGFYLPFKQDYTVEGFSTTLYEGTDSNQYIGGLGFNPDLLWLKHRDISENHFIVDSIRGAGVHLRSDQTLAESDNSSSQPTFENDGFTLAGANQQINDDNNGFVAWSWDMGGTTVSNSDGTITADVRANPTYGQSIVSYVGTGASGSIGTGLTSPFEIAFIKNRDTTDDWAVLHGNAGDFLVLNQNYANNNNSGQWTAKDSSTITLGGWNTVNKLNDNMIAYCFHSVAGYSKIGSWTTTGLDEINVGFRPMWVLTKRIDGNEDWLIHDRLRDTENLKPSQPNTETTSSWFEWTDTGFTYNETSGRDFIYYAIADTREFAYWLDDSGNNNDFTPNNLTESDISLDSPSNNYAVLNNLSKSLGVTLTKGNSNASIIETNYGVPSTIAINNGDKIYFEVLITTNTYGVTNGMQIGVVSSEYGFVNNYAYSIADFYYAYAGNGGKRDMSSLSAYGDTYTLGDIIGVEVDNNLGNITFYKNGVSQGVAFTGIGNVDYRAIVMNGNGVAGTMGYFVNFGQDSSFAGNKVAQGNTDSKGYGDFYYAPPSGYLSLCTANLPEPTVVPSEHFGIGTYNGTGALQTIVTGVDTDFAWFKCRNTAINNVLYDVIRGTARLESNNTNVEGTRDGFNSFASNGVVVDDDGGGGGVNFPSGRTYVTWNWKAGGTAVSNTDGTITSQVSANVDAGFSIVAYTPTASNETVGHGLNSQIELYIVKKRDSSADWTVQTNVIDNIWKYGYLNQTSVFNNGATPNANSTTIIATESSNNCIAYCFHSVEGYSKVGSYIGNGSTDGTFVYCGFRPKYVLIKNTDSATNWEARDTEREPENTVELRLFPNLPNAESDSNEPIDYLSNGFKVRTTASGWNGSGHSILFMAFAESPFKYTNAR